MSCKKIQQLTLPLGLVGVTWVPLCPIPGGSTGVFCGEGEGTAAPSAVSPLCGGGVAATGAGGGVPFFGGSDVLPGK